MKTLQQLKTFEDACEVEGLDAAAVINGLASLPELDHEPITAHAKLLIIVRAANRIVNDGKPWIPDWNNYDEYKYYPWFYMAGSSGFRFRACGGWDSSSSVGSRLCYKTYEAAEHIGETFVELYKDLMVIK